MSKKLVPVLIAVLIIASLVAGCANTGTGTTGGEKVKVIDGVYYCPVREKANDVDSALCPFCPALQTPEMGYLKPPMDAGRHRKEEFLRQTFDRHHYNG